MVKYKGNNLETSNIWCKCSLLVSNNFNSFKCFHQCLPEVYKSIAGYFDVPSMPSNLANICVSIQIDDIRSGIGDTNTTKEITEDLKEAISLEMKDSSNKRMKAGNLNASLEAINLLLRAHELHHNIPCNHEVQVGLTIIKITTYTLLESTDNTLKDYRIGYSGVGQFQG